MNWNPCETQHDWQHIFEWHGRYKCSKCAVIGYKNLAVLPRDVLSKKVAGTLITPYKCPQCHGPTHKYRVKRAGEFRVKHGAQLCPVCMVQ